MKKLLSVFPTLLTILYTFVQVLVPIQVLAQSREVVDCTLEWHSGHQTYTYVFSGVVSSQGRPCPNAKIQLQLSAPSQPDLIQETTASAEGAYELKIILAGNPQESADWKLVAQAPETSAEAAEIEGRTIFTDGENMVMVQRPIQLVQG